LSILRAKFVAPALHNDENKDVGNEDIDNNNDDQYR
jgi:hypothetical protein